MDCNELSNLNTVTDYCTQVRWAGQQRCSAVACPTNELLAGLACCLELELVEEPDRSLVAQSGVVVLAPTIGQALARVRSAVARDGTTQTRIVRGPVKGLAFTTTGLSTPLRNTSTMSASWRFAAMTQRASDNRTSNFWSPPNRPLVR
ncbi:MAG: hypothetical protein V1907_00535 [Candidatus Kerfeldbacteria bacterium]